MLKKKIIQLFYTLIIILTLASCNSVPKYHLIKTDDFCRMDFFWNYSTIIESKADLVLFNQYQKFNKYDDKFFEDHVLLYVRLPIFYFDLPNVATGIKSYTIEDDTINLHLKTQKDKKMQMKFSFLELNKEKTTNLKRVKLLQGEVETFTFDIKNQDKLYFYDFSDDNNIYAYTYPSNYKYFIKDEYLHLKDNEVHHELIYSYDRLDNIFNEILTVPITDYFSKSIFDDNYLLMYYYGNTFPYDFFEFADFNFNEQTFTFYENYTHSLVQSNSNAKTYFYIVVLPKNKLPSDFDPTKEYQYEHITTNILK